jgi:hypothetical protein
MKDSRLHFGGMEGAEARFVSLGWPTDMDDIMSDLQIYAKDLYLVAQAFFDMNFPDYSWRVRFGAFRLGSSRLPVVVAKEFIRELAVKEGQIQRRLCISTSRCYHTCRGCSGRQAMTAKRGSRAWRGFGGRISHKCFAQTSAIS